MNVQQQWDALCTAFRLRDWATLDLLLEEFQERLDAGEAPVISEEVSSSFNHAMATAGIAFIRSQFSRTDEWPVAEILDASRADSAVCGDSDVAPNAGTSDPAEEDDAAESDATA